MNTVNLQKKIKPFYDWDGEYRYLTNVRSMRPNFTLKIACDGFQKCSFFSVDESCSAITVYFSSLSDID